MHLFRDRGWAVRVPRSLQEMSRRVAAVRERIGPSARPVARRSRSWPRRSARPRSASPRRSPPAGRTPPSRWSNRTPRRSPARPSGVPAGRVLATEEAGLHGAVEDRDLLERAMRALPARERRDRRPARLPRPHPGRDRRPHGHQPDARLAAPARIARDDRASEIDQAAVACSATALRRSAERWRRRSRAARVGTVCRRSSMPGQLEQAAHAVAGALAERDAEPDPALVGPLAGADQHAQDGRVDERRLQQVDRDGATRVERRVEPPLQLGGGGEVVLAGDASRPRRPARLVRRRFRGHERQDSLGRPRPTRSRRRRADGERHPHQRPGAARRVDLERVGDRGHHGQPDAEAGAVDARRHARCRGRAR